MPEAAKTPHESPMDGLKAYIGEQIGRTVETINRMDGQLEEALHELGKKAPAEIVEQVDRLAKNLEALSNRADALEGNGPPPSQSGDGPRASVRRCIKESPYMKGLREHGVGQLIPGMNGLKVPSLTRMQKQIRRQVDIETSSLARPVSYRDTLVEYALERSTLVDRVPQETIDEGTYTFFRENRIAGEGGIVTTADGAVVGGAGATIKFTSVANLMNGSTGYIERTDGAGILLGYESFTVLSFVAGTRVVTMTANIAGDVADGDKIQFTPYTATAEGETKPYTWYGEDDFNVSLVMQAVMARLSKASLNRDDRLEAKLTGKMRRTHIRALARLLLYGTGTGQQVQGFLSAADRQTYAWSSGATGDTMADAVLKAALLIPDPDMPLEVTITRTNWLQLRIEKGSDGHYIYTPANGPVAVIDRPGIKSLAGLIVHTEPLLKANGDFMIANHMEASELVMLRNSAQFLFGYDGTDFSSNRISARYEEELAHAILSYQWYVHGQFDSRP